mmetsp:Transcript_60790/g.169950  ORF Transcript_60790/g.169950 Transcript_60790/m.169950 type:complete len:547 (+) Transcript_60790:91-1731(+)
MSTTMSDIDLPEVKVATKDPVPLPVFVFAMCFNTIFAALKMNRMSIDIYVISKLQGISGEPTELRDMYSLWARIYRVLTEPRWLSPYFFEAAVVGVLLLLMPLLVWDAIASIRRHAPRARWIADLTSFALLCFMLIGGFVVQGPLERTFMAECTFDPELATCEPIGQQLLAVHCVFFGLQVLLPFLNVVKWRANAKFEDMYERLEDAAKALQLERARSDLRALGCEFSDCGRLTQVGSGQGFHISCDDGKETIMAASYRYIRMLLLTEHKMNAVIVPFVEAKKGERDMPMRTVSVISTGTRSSCSGSPHFKAFVTQGSETADKLMLIIQDKPCGVWDIDLCVSKGIDFGTAFPYIDMAKQKGYSVIVFNVTENDVYSAERHVASAWQYIIAKTSCVIVDVVAHSEGGRALCCFLARAMKDSTSEANAATDACRRTHRIAFIDSQHTDEQVGGFSASLAEMFRNPHRVVHYVPHTKRAGEIVDIESEKRCRCISAGVQESERSETSFKMMQSAFDFFAAKDAVVTSGRHSIRHGMDPNRVNRRRSIA